MVRIDTPTDSNKVHLLEGAFLSGYLPISRMWLTHDWWIVPAAALVRDRGDGEGRWITAAFDWMPFRVPAEV